MAYCHSNFLSLFNRRQRSYFRPHHTATVARRGRHQPAVGVSRVRRTAAAAAPAQATATAAGNATAAVAAATVVGTGRTATPTA